MAPHFHDTSLTCKSRANQNEEAGKEVIVMNCIWLICY